MKIKVPAQHLAYHCGIASKVIAKVAVQLPVLSNVELEAVGDKITLRATNLDIMFRASVKGEVLEEGKILVPLKRLWQFVRPEKGEIEISNTGKMLVRLSADSGKTSLELKSFGQLADFPALPSMNDSALEFDESLVRDLGYALPFTSPESVRPVLTTVFVEANDGYLDIAAADGFRLIWIRKKLEDLTSFKMLIPRRTCQLLKSIFRGKIKMGFQTLSKEGAPPPLNPSYIDGRVWFFTDDMLLISQTAQGTFPNYKKLVPVSSDEDWHFTCSAPLLQQRVEQFEGMICKLISHDGYLKLSMSVDEDCLTSLIPVQAMKNEGKVAAGREYLIEIARNFAEINVRCKTPADPILFTGDLEGVTIVLMPMFIQW